MTKNKIYVDAGCKNNLYLHEWTIGLYHRNINLQRNLKLKDIPGNTQTEIYGILAAIDYINNHNIKNPHIYCDNKPAVQNKHIQKIIAKKKIKISWIPRTSNRIADALTHRKSKSKKGRKSRLEEIWNSVLK